MSDHPHSYDASTSRIGKLAQVDLLDTRKYACVCVCVWAGACTCACACVRTRLRVRVRVRARACVSTCVTVRASPCVRACVRHGPCVTGAYVRAHVLMKKPHRCLRYPGENTKMTNGHGFVHRGPALNLDATNPECWRGLQPGMLEIENRLQLNSEVPSELLLSQLPTCQLFRGPSPTFRGVPLPSYLFSDEPRTISQTNFGRIMIQN